MLSLQQCRELLGSDAKLNDAELEALRNHFYALAKIAVAMHASTVATWERLDESERYTVGERAAILEFEGKLPRVAAEHTAMVLATKPPH